MGFTEEQNEYYVKASARLIRQQIIKLMKNIPVVEIQKLDDVSKSDTEKMQEILQKNLTESEFIEYSIWAWLLTKIEEFIEQTESQSKNDNVTRK